MSTSVDNVQGAVAAVVEQDENTANIAVDDYSLRLNYINSREQSWAEIAKWRSLYKEFNGVAVGSLVTLPEDFRVEASFPVIEANEYPIVTPTQKGQKTVTDTYVTVEGNTNNGLLMKIYPSATSGTSVMVPYYARPTSLASPANLISCPNPDYIVTGVIADIWEAREDARFQLKKNEADEILKNMLEFEQTPSEGADNDRVKTVEQTRYGFRWGH